MFTKPARSPEFLALSPQHQLFVTAYLEEFDAKDAYAKAGYEGTNPNTNAYRILHQPDVEAVVRAELDKLLDKLGITPGKILRDLEVVRIKALAAGRFAAALRATELQAKYLNLFPGQYRHALDGVSDADVDAADQPTAIPLSDVGRLLAFILAGASRAKANGANGSSPGQPGQPVKH